MDSEYLDPQGGSWVWRILAKRSADSNSPKDGENSTKNEENQESVENVSSDSNSSGTQEEHKDTTSQKPTRKRNETKL